MGPQGNMGQPNPSLPLGQQADHPSHARPFSRPSLRAPTPIQPYRLPPRPDSQLQGFPFPPDVARYPPARREEDEYVLVRASLLRHYGQLLEENYYLKQLLPDYQRLESQMTVLEQSNDELVASIVELVAENDHLQEVNSQQSERIGTLETEVAVLNRARQEDSLDDDLHDLCNFFRDWVLEPAFAEQRNQEAYSGVFSTFQDLLQCLVPPNPMILRTMSQAEQKALKEKRVKAVDMVASVGLKADFVSSLMQRVAGRNLRRHVFGHTELNVAKPDAYIKQVLKGLQASVAAIEPNFAVAHLKPDIENLLTILSHRSFDPE